MATIDSSHRIVISGSGLWTPPNVITNEELVASYNRYAEKFNAEHAADIAAGKIEEKPLSTERFIEKASGIKSRYVYTREGILDIDRMRPKFPERKEEELSNQAEIAVYAAREAMAAAGKTASDIDAVIVACAYTQRAYPAIAIEVQNELGIEGFGFDMLLACSAATFGLHRAYDSLVAGSAKCVLAINPELVTPQVNFRDRDSHFIFGDVSTAVIMERADTCTSSNSYEILSTKALTRYSIQYPLELRAYVLCQRCGSLRVGQAVSSVRAQGLRGSQPRCRQTYQRPPGQSRFDAPRRDTFLDSPGQYQYEQDGDETTPRSRANGRSGADHSRPVRKHGVGRVHHRVSIYIIRI